MPPPLVTHKFMVELEGIVLELDGRELHSASIVCSGWQPSVLGDLKASSDRQVGFVISLSFVILFNHPNLHMHIDPMYVSWYTMPHFVMAPFNIHATGASACCLMSLLMLLSTIPLFFV